MKDMGEGKTKLFFRRKMMQTRRQRRRRKQRIESWKGGAYIHTDRIATEKNYAINLKTALNQVRREVQKGA